MATMDQNRNEEDLDNRNKTTTSPHQSTSQAEPQQLEQQLRLFNTTLNAISDFAYIFDSNGRFRYANKPLLDLLGITLDEIIGKNFHDLNYPPALAARLQEQIQQVFDTKEALRDETPFTSPTGKLGFYEYIFTPVFASGDSSTNGDSSNDAAVQFVAGSTRDVTDRKQVEIALYKSEQRFRTLSDVVPQLIWTNLATGEANYFNQRWYEYSGLTYEESFGLGWQVMVHPDDAAASVKRWQEALGDGKVFETEYRLRRHDGVYRWHLGRNVPLREESDGDSGGRIVGWFGSATDIEELKQAEEARRQSEERFRLLVEGARDYAMFLQDPEGRVTFWSAGAERLFGWNEAEMLGQCGDIVFVPEDRERGVPEEERVTARSDGQALDRRWKVRKDGSRFWADGLLMRLDDESGALRGFAKVARDATEQKRAEDALRASEEAVRKANEALEQRVQERTSALVQRTSELARMSEMRQELLRQLVSAQEEERARISRDLHDDTGQQLTALLLGLNHLERSAVVQRDAEAQELLAHLRTYAGEVAKKSHQLSFTLRPTALDDIGLLEALQNYTEEWSRWSGLPVELQSVGLKAGQHRLPPEIETTIYRVTQEALTNVLRHAVAAKPDQVATGASRVSITLQQRDEREISVFIEDDGPGFDVEATLNLPPSQRRIGIFGMQERARLAGGTLSVESAPGKGTTVYLRLPLSGT